MRRNIFLLVNVFVALGFILLGWVVRADVIDVTKEQIVHVNEEIQNMDEADQIMEGDIVYFDEDDVVDMEEDPNFEVKPVRGNKLFVPQCSPGCKPTEFCNFAKQCEPYPILLMECAAGGACGAKGNNCHCSGSCVDEVCYEQ